MVECLPIDDTIESVVRQGCSECEILILRNDIQSLPQGTDVAENNVSYLDSDYLLREIFIREKGKGNALNEEMLLQILINVVRLIGMITFYWRRLGLRSNFK